MTLKKNILIGYGVALALMGLVIAWAVMHLVSLGRASDAILRENYQSILAAGNMLDVLQRQDRVILLMFLGNEMEGRTKFRESEAVFLGWLARAQDNVTIPGEAGLVYAIEMHYTKYRERFYGLTDTFGVKERSTAFSLRAYRDAISPLFKDVHDDCVRLRRLNEEAMHAASLRASRVAGRAIWSTVLAAASASIVALIFSLLLAGRIVMPLRHLMEASRKISEGDYAVQVPLETGDELGRLAGEFNQMAVQLGRYHEMNIDQLISEKTKGEAILSSIEDGLVVFDTNLAVTDINPAACRMLDLQGNACKTLPCTEILRSTQIIDMLRETVEMGGQPILPDEERVVTLPQGEHSRHYQFSVTAIRGRDQHLSGVVLLLRDISRLKELEQLRSDFVMAASHELRTPLTSLDMSIDLLREHAAPGLAPRDRDLLQTAHEEVQRMKTLVVDLLDLTKIEAGRIAMEFQKVSVSVLFEHVFAIFKDQAARKRVQLSFGASTDLPDVRADANKIGWVLTNLISNALRYVHEGGHVRLTANRLGPNVHLSVCDDGSGIPPEYQEKIFQKYFQVEAGEAGGTGLGLAISQEIVRAHGGTIWVDSIPGQGCTFTFTLPLAP